MGQQGSEQEKREPIITKREPDLALWQEARELSTGSASKKQQAVSLIFEHYPDLPEEADNLLRELALPNNPVSVRRSIARNLARHPRIPWGLYSSVLQILSKDSDQRVAKTVEPLRKPLKAIGESLKCYAERQRAFATDIGNMISRLTAMPSGLGATIAMQAAFAERI